MARHLKLQTGDLLLKTDGDKVQLVGADYTLTAGAGSYIITGSDVGLLRYTIFAGSGEYTITGSDVTLTHSRVIVKPGWKTYVGEGPWDFTEQVNQTETPHKPCGYWWKGEDY